MLHDEHHTNSNTCSNNELFNVTSLSICQEQHIVPAPPPPPPRPEIQIFRIEHSTLARQLASLLTTIPEDLCSTCTT